MIDRGAERSELDSDEHAAMINRYHANALRAVVEFA
jgi:hypothetical protein